MLLAAYGNTAAKARALGKCLPFAVPTEHLFDFAHATSKFAGLFVRQAISACSSFNNGGGGLCECKYFGTNRCHSFPFGAQ